jgi:hypothetical protein
MRKKKPNKENEASELVLLIFHPCKMYRQIYQVCNGAKSDRISEEN